MGRSNAGRDADRNVDVQRGFRRRVHRGRNGRCRPVLKEQIGSDVTDFELGDTYKFSTPVWYILWGTKKAGYAAIVDASTGKVLKK